MCQAATTFSRGLYDALGRGCAGGPSSGTVSISDAYAAGDAAFRQAGFVRSDPEGPLGRAAHGYYDMLVSRAKSRAGERRGSAPTLRHGTSAYVGDAATFGASAAALGASGTALGGPATLDVAMVRVSRIKTDPTQGSMTVELGPA